MADRNPDVKRKRSSSSFLSGIVILTISNLLVKAAGLMFKVPMNYIIGDTGMGYYNSAYSVYTFFYMLSTSGLPVALSVMVSEKRAEGNMSGAKTVYRMALLTFAIIGAAAFAVMFFASEGLSEIIGSARSAIPVMAIAPTMFFICISSAWRGYFQGCGNMVPTAVSQLIEALGKLFIGIAAAVYAVNMGYETHIVSAYGIMGLTLGSLCGAVYLMISKFMRGDRDLLPDDLSIKNSKIEKKEILYRFIKISIPVTVSASVMSITNMIDTALIQRMLSQSGMSEEMTATLYGNYTSLAVPMFNLPPVFVYPIAYSLVPIVASAASSGKLKNVSDIIEKSIRIAAIIGLPCALGLSILADPILCLFYKDTSAHLASPLLSMLAPSSFFVCILAVTNSILQGCGKERLPVISMLAGAVVKYVASVILIPKYGISGAPISTFLCYLTVTALNFSFVIKFTGIHFSFAKTFMKPLVASVICAFTAFYVNAYLRTSLGDSLACAAALIAAIIIYLFAILILKAVSYDEIHELIGNKAKERKKQIETIHGTIKGKAYYGKRT